MQLRALCVVSTVLALHLTHGVTVAHHSFAGEFDNAVAVTLQGVVTEIEMVNPHSFIYLEVKTNDRVERWALEGPAPRQILRMGLGLEAIKAGDQLGACGYLGRSDLASSRRELRSAAGSVRKLQAAVLTMPDHSTRVWNNYHQGKCGLDT